MRTKLNSRGLIRPADIGGDTQSQVAAQKLEFAKLLILVQKTNENFTPKSFEFWLSRDSRSAIDEMKSIVSVAVTNQAKGDSDAN